MTGPNHLFVHYLDLLRHWFAAIWQPFNWGPNFSAWIICGGIAAFASYLLWPRVRKRFDAWIHKHLAKNAAITAELKSHIESSNAELHRKLDVLLSSAGPSIKSDSSSGTVEKETSMGSDLPTEILDDLAKRFRWPPSSDAVAAMHGKVRQLLEGPAIQLVEALPQGREASLVLTKLEEVAFWAHAAIARNQPAPASAAPVDDVPAPKAPAEAPPPAEAAAAVPESAPVTATPTPAAPVEALPDPSAVPPSAPAPEVLFAFAGDPTTVDLTVWPKADVVTPASAPLFTWNGQGPAPVGGEWTPYTGPTQPAPAATTG